MPTARMLIDVKDLTVWLHNSWDGAATGCGYEFDRFKVVVDGAAVYTCWLTIGEGSSKRLAHGDADTAYWAITNAVNQFYDLEGDRPGDNTRWSAKRLRDDLFSHYMRNTSE